MRGDRLKPWKTISRQTILDHSKWLRVEDHTIELPDGTTIANWPWVISPDYVNVVVVDERGLFVCFRQTKYAVDGVTIAPAGGYLDDGEAPLAASKRELSEEMGLSADEWHHLGSYPVDGNHGAGTAHLYLALGAKRSVDPIEDDLEEQVVVHLTREEIGAALQRGEVKVLSWSAAFALALHFLNHRTPKAV